MTVNNPSFSSPSLQTSMLGVHISGLVYQNFRRTPRYCQVSISAPTGGICEVKSDSNAVPTLRIAYADNANLLEVTSVLTFLVLPGYYYSLTNSGGATIVSWIELN